MYPFWYTHCGARQKFLYFLPFEKIGLLCSTSRSRWQQRLKMSVNVCPNSIFCTSKSSCIVMHYHKPKCHAKRLTCYLQGQGHRAHISNNQCMCTHVTKWTLNRVVYGLPVCACMCVYCMQWERHWVKCCRVFKVTLFSWSCTSLSTLLFLYCAFQAYVRCIYFILFLHYVMSQNCAFLSAQRMQCWPSTQSW